MKANKRCINCNNCKTVYDKSCYLPSGKRLHYCTLREDITELKNGCESWQKRKIEYDLSPERFNEVEKDIGYLIGYLKAIEE